MPLPLPLPLPLSAAGADVNVDGARIVLEDAPCDGLLRDEEEGSRFEFGSGDWFEVDANSGWGCNKEPIRTIVSLYCDFAELRLAHVGSQGRVVDPPDEMLRTKRGWD